MNPTRSRHVERHADRLVATGLVLLAALPAIMTFARTSPSLIAAIIALLIGIAASVTGFASTMERQSKQFLLRPAGMLLVAGLLLMALSLLWTPAPERAMRHFLHVLGSVLIIGVLMTGVPLRQRKKLTFLMPLGLAAASLLVVVHMTLSSPINATLGIPTEGYYVNRTAVALALFAPMVLAALWLGGKLLVTCALAILILIAIWLSDSWSAKLASLAILVFFPLSLLSPRGLHLFAALGILLTLLAAPFYAGSVNNFVPQSIHDAVGYRSLTIRGEIWREYTSLIWQQPFFGFGFEASNAIAATDIVVVLTDAQLRLLSSGHPHNAVVQIWFELGVAGVLIAASLLGLLFHTMTRLKDCQLSIATTTSVGIYTVACVSHGAWQAWWICLVGLVAFAFMMQMVDLNKPDTQGQDAGNPQP